MPNETPVTTEVIPIVDISHTLEEYESSTSDGSDFVDATNEQEDSTDNSEEDPNINNNRAFLDRS